MDVEVSERSALDRVYASGVHAASMPDLVAIALSRRSCDVSLAEPAARELLMRMRSARGLSEVNRKELMDATGLDDFEAIRMQALMEIGRRSTMAGPGVKDTVESSDDVYALLDHLRYEKREHFVAILLNAKGGLMRVATIHVGTLTMSVVGAREVFREAINDGAASIIVAHNHPSGDPTPSPEDIEVTERLVEIGHLLDIPVVDHVVIGDGKYVSIAERGLLRRK